MPPFWTKDLPKFTHIPEQSRAGTSERPAHGVLLLLRARFLCATDDDAGPLTPTRFASYALCDMNNSRSTAAGGLGDTSSAGATSTGRLSDYLSKVSQ